VVWIIAYCPDDFIAILEVKLRAISAMNHTLIVRCMQMLKEIIRHILAEYPVDYISPTPNVLSPQLEFLIKVNRGAHFSDT